MTRSNRYYTLVASLPAMPRHFEVEHLPIAQPRLEERMRMLKAEDAQVVGQLLAFLHWDRQPKDRTDEEVIAHYNALMPRTKNRLARHIVTFQMDIRMIMSGLRHRRRGLPAPLGVGQWVDHIRRNWALPEFSLHWQYPWIAEMDRLLSATDCLRVERIKLEVIWNHWYELASQYFFTFEAVLLYLARWEIINRWTSRDAVHGRRRFEQLVTESLSEYVNSHR